VHILPWGAARDAIFVGNCGGHSQRLLPAKYQKCPGGERMMMREKFSLYYFAIPDKIKTQQSTACKHSPELRCNLRI